MRWVFLIQFCVGCWYTIASGFQLSYTPRCGKELLFSFVEECVTASTGLPAKRYPQIKGCAEYFLFNFREGCVTASTGLPILPPCHASFSRRCALRAGAPPFPCGSNRAGAKCVRRTGENCVQGGARGGRAASRWSVRRTGKNCVQGGAAGRVASRRKRPARTGKNCVQEGARAERAASRWERPARTGENCAQGGARAGRAASRWSVRRARAKIARKEARVPGGRQTNGSVSRTGDNYA